MKILLFLFGFILFLFIWPLGLLIMIAVIIWGVSGTAEERRNKQLIAEIGALREDQFQLNATPEMKVERPRNIEAKRQQDQKASVIKWSVLGGVTLLIVVFAHSGGNKAEVAFSPDPVHPSPAVVETSPASTPAWNTVLDARRPTKTVVEIASATPGPSIAGDTYIPDPSIKQALVAFNELQDQYRRPHINRVQYTASTDSYYWIGPKLGKRVVMSRSEFDVEVWNDYYKKHQSSEISQ